MRARDLPRGTPRHGLCDCRMVDIRTQATRIFALNEPPRIESPSAPEREAEVGAFASPSSAFVVQKHAAARLHYDLFLQLHGVLKSWVIPLGPSLDPEEPALAVQLDDRPLESGFLEGVSSPDDHGWGACLLWDRGGWSPEGDPARGYERGRIKLRFHGQRLRGRWLLARTELAGSPFGRTWLLRKLTDQHARPGDPRGLLETESASVATGRTLEDLARSPTSAGPDRDGGVRTPPPVGGEAPRSAFPAQFEPQVPVGDSSVPEGDAWVHEPRYEGCRMLLRIEGRQVRAVTAEGHDCEEGLTEVLADAGALGVEDTLLDGEVVVLLPDGTLEPYPPRQDPVGAAGHLGQVLFFAFDLPHYRGHDLTSRPLVERKRVLRALIPHPAHAKALRYSHHMRGRGPRVLERACQFALGGIISKRADAPYRQGRHSSWVQVECLRRRPLVVGGWTAPSDGRAGFDALLVGGYDASGRLRYAGRLHAGFTPRTRAQVYQRLQQASISVSPFVGPPDPPEAAEVRWAEPRTVVGVEFAHQRADGLLAHATFRDLQADTLPEEARWGPGRQDPMSAGADAPDGRRVAGIRLSNPGDPLHPSQGRTKEEVARHFERVADLILPHLLGRPLAIVRGPSDPEDACVREAYPSCGVIEPVRGIGVEEGNEVERYLAVDNVEGLVALVELGALEIHRWGSRADQLDRPDRLVLGVMPGPEVAWQDVVEAAFALRERLEELELVSFVGTTGTGGLHVVIPVVRRAGWREAGSFARALAEGMAARYPDQLTVASTPAERRGRVVIDTAPCQRGGAAVAPYSPRARPEAPVATPLTWDELSRAPSPSQYTVRNFRGRLKRVRTDPWEGIQQVRQSITKRAQAAAAS